METVILKETSDRVIYKEQDLNGVWCTYSRSKIDAWDRVTLHVELPKKQPRTMHPSIIEALERQQARIAKYQAKKNANKLGILAKELVKV